MTLLLCLFLIVYLLTYVMYNTGAFCGSVLVPRRRRQCSPAMLCHAVHCSTVTGLSCLQLAVPHCSRVSL